jgi:16S rRNA pseudouridine516 synthase
LWEPQGVTHLRLDRAIANLGYGTRREAQRAVRDGRVTVAGEVVRGPEHHADPADIALDGEALEFPHGLFVSFHKPVGVVCSHEDKDGPPVYDLLPARWLARNPKVTSVGRLDKDSSGLLLVTDILALVHQLAAPRHHVEKRYIVGLDLPLSERELADMAAVFAAGTIMLKGEDDPCLPAVLRATDRPDHIEVVLTEGRHRQVRRMIGACGPSVASLHRVAVGPYVLGDLAEGEWRAEDPSLVTVE